MTVTKKSDEVRNSWRDMLDTVSRGDSVVIERYNKPVAALIRYDIFLALQEEIEELKAAERARLSVEEWRRDPSTARSWEEVKAELTAEGVLNGDE
jgi:PHD/YefM family antitoxin component YafN of YafNO toxin-antitoxin module